MYKNDPERVDDTLKQFIDTKESNFINKIVQEKYNDTNYHFDAFFGQKKNYFNCLFMKKENE